MIDPTRKEWLSALKRANAAIRAVAPTHSIVEAALGPCPPEPAPPHHRVAGRVAVSPSLDKGMVWTIHGGNITPDEAEAMAAALVRHARYAREQAAASDA